jgi:hypothetical protein
LKLRIYEHSIRIRLDGDECRQLARSGRVERTLPAGPTEAQHFIYSIETDAAASGAFVSFHEGHLRVLILPRDARNLADETEVAVEAVQIVDGTTSLSIIVERDYTP